MRVTTQNKHIPKAELCTFIALSYEGLDLTCDLYLLEPCLELIMLGFNYVISWLMQPSDDDDNDDGSDDYVNSCISLSENQIAFHCMLQSMFNTHPICRQLTRHI